MRSFRTTTLPLHVVGISVTAMSQSETDLTTPEFRGCVFCYSAEWGIYGARKAAKRLDDDEDD